MPNGTANPEQSSFDPIAELRAAGTDVGLLFLSANDVVFQGPTNDALFAAHMPIQAKLGFMGKRASMQFYARDEPASVLGCIARYQFCDSTVAAAHASSGASDGRHCTPLEGIAMALEHAEELWGANRRQARLFKWVTGALLQDPPFLWMVPQAVRSAALEARYAMMNGLQGPLPPNQWQREIEGWFKTTLAHAQRAVLELAMGPLDPKQTARWCRRRRLKSRLLCRSQVSETLRTVNY